MQKVIIFLVMLREAKLHSLIMLMLAHKNPIGQIRDFVSTVCPLKKFYNKTSVFL